MDGGVFMFRTHKWVIMNDGQFVFCTNKWVIMNVLTLPITGSYLPITILQMALQ